LNDRLKEYQTRKSRTRKPAALDTFPAIPRRSVTTVRQLRLHPALVALKERLASESSSIRHDVSLTYVAGRGPWYGVSWKGETERSGCALSEVSTTVIGSFAIRISKNPSQETAA
jgi:hypothetical protein